jgi:hypothetical protein
MKGLLVHAPEKDSHAGQRLKANDTTLTLKLRFRGPIDLYRESSALEQFKDASHPITLVLMFQSTVGTPSGGSRSCSQTFHCIVALIKDDEMPYIIVRDA